ncbi:MAG: hypothetical protein Phog2KO_19000 [Phototrophicaceae bacterium]
MSSYAIALRTCFKIMKLLIFWAGHRPRPYTKQYFLRVGEGFKSSQLAKVEYAIALIILTYCLTNLSGCCIQYTIIT